MSRYYAELHDRELLIQAETILAEVHRRNLIEVFLPPVDCSPEEAEKNLAFPRRLASVSSLRGKLKLMVESDFFRRS